MSFPWDPKNDFFQYPPVVVIERGKAKSEMLAEAVVAGAGGGRIAYEPRGWMPGREVPVFIGMRPLFTPVLHELHRTHRSYVTVDNGYFRPYKEGGYFRVTQNGLQTTGAPDQAELEALIRWDGLGLQIEPRRAGGDYILLVLQSEAWYDMVLQKNREDWVREALTMLEREYPGVPIRVRDKPLKARAPVAPLVEDLAGARLVAGLSSAVMLTASLAGIPVLPIGRCAASPLSVRTMLDDQRLAVFSNLAANQWTVEEIAAGVTWKTLSQRKAPFFLDLA